MKLAFLCVVTDKRKQAESYTIFVEDMVLKFLTLLHSLNTSNFKLRTSTCLLF